MPKMSRTALRQAVKAKEASLEARDLAEEEAAQTPEGFYQAMSEAVGRLPPDDADEETLKQQMYVVNAALKKIGRLLMKAQKHLTIDQIHEVLDQVGLSHEEAFYLMNKHLDAENRSFALDAYFNYQKELDRRLSALHRQSDTLPAKLGELRLKHILQEKQECYRLMDETLKQKGLPGSFENHFLSDLKKSIEE